MGERDPLCPLPALQVAVDVLDAVPARGVGQPLRLVPLAVSRLALRVEDAAVDPDVLAGLRVRPAGRRAALAAVELDERWYEPAGPQSTLQPPAPGGTTMHWPGLALGGQRQFPFLSITVPVGHAAVAGLRPPDASHSSTAAASEKSTCDEVIRIDMGRLPAMHRRAEDKSRRPSDATPRSPPPPASRLACPENASRRKPFPAALSDAPRAVLLFLFYRPLGLDPETRLTATLARPLPFGYDNPAMDPSDPAALFTPRFFPPGSQNAWCPALAQGLGGSPRRVDVPVGAEGQPAATQGDIPPVARISDERRTQCS